LQRIGLPAHEPPIVCDEAVAPPRRRLDAARRVRALAEDRSEMRQAGVERSLESDEHLAVPEAVPDLRARDELTGLRRQQRQDARPLRRQTKPPPGNSGSPR
jgi:hypothetical protein